MFITKSSLSRRTFLRGLGATLALPLLDAMVPALTPMARTAAAPTRRFGAVFVPMGERPSHWTPTTTGVGFEFSPILKPIENVPRLTSRWSRTSIGRCRARTPSAPARG